MKNQLKTIVLLGSLSAIIVGLGALVAPGYLYLFGALALAMNLGAYFFSGRIVLRMHHAQELSPREAPDLHERVGRLLAMVSSERRAVRRPGASRLLLEW